MFASIDAAVGTIEGQIRKYKTRLARRLRQDAFVRSPSAEEVSFIPDGPEEEFEIVLAEKVPHEAHDPGGSDFGR